MNSISFVIIICAAVFASGSLEQFNERSWMDKQGRDKYFEYSSELVVPAAFDENSVEVVQPVEIVTKVRE